MKQMIRRRRASSTVLVLLTISACSQQARSSSAEPEQPSTAIGSTVPNTNAEPGRSEPSDTSANVSDFASIDDVQYLLTAFHQIRYPSVSMQTGKLNFYFECMSKAGFDVPVALRPTPRAFPTSTALALLGEMDFEMKSLDDVRSKAYNAPDSAGDGYPVPIDDPLTDWILALPADQMRRYEIADLGDGKDPLVVQTSSGTFQYPNSGCEFESTEALFGDAEEMYQLVAQLNSAESDLFVGAYASSTYGSAVEAWRACVKGAGFQVSTPEEMPGDDSLRDNVALAVADWTCRAAGAVSVARKDAILEQANKMSPTLAALQSEATDLMSAAEVRSVELAG